MAEKADASQKNQKQPASKQPVQERLSGPEGQFQEGAADLASALDAPDPGSQAQRLVDARFPAVQRQALAGRIGRRQGNRHLSNVLAGSPARAPGGIIQRQPLRGIVGQTLATIHLSNQNRTTAEGQVTVEDELVPDGQQAGRFDGYGRRIQAQSRAAAETNLCAVVEDAQGKFHALRTGWPGRTPDVQADFELAGSDFRHVWWVNRPGRRGTMPELGSQSWQERVNRALRWKTDMVLHRVPADFETFCNHRPSHAGPGATAADVRQCLEFEFADLLATVLDIDAVQVHIVQRGGRPNRDALVNFNIDLDSRGRGGLGQLPQDERTQARRPTVTVGPSAFESESELSVLATTIHESEHVRQANVATDLLEQWRRGGGQPDFPQWLRRRLNRRRITQEQHDLALELWQGGNRSGEVLSYIEGFIRTYPRRPITGLDARFSSLVSGARYYRLSGSAHIKAMAMQRLATCYASLDEAHQADFADHAREFARVRDEDRQGFWQDVVAQVL